MMTTALADTIGQTWFGTDLSTNQRERLAELARAYEVPAQTTLLREGERTAELGVVVAGRVALTEHVAGRGSLTLMTVETGDVFGWSVLVPPYIAISSVTSLEPVRVVAVDGPGLRAALADDCQLAAAVQHKVLESLARRLQATRHQLLDLYGAGWVEPVYEPW